MVDWLAINGGRCSLIKPLGGLVGLENGWGRIGSYDADGLFGGIFCG